MSNQDVTFCLPATQSSQLLARKVGTLPAPGFCMLNNDGQEVFTSVQHARDPRYSSILLQGENAWHCPPDTLFRDCIAQTPRVPGNTRN